MPLETNVAPRTDLTRFLSPRSIAVIGASNDADRIGGQTIKLLTNFGFKGNVYPVNPKYGEIAGLKCYPDVASVPRPCDVVLIAVAGAQVPAVIEQCGKAGISFAIVLSAGFGEVEDGAFPSLAVGATELLFEDLWRDGAEMSPREAQLTVDRLMLAGSHFRKFLEKTR